ncbi:exonuclease domain-containing protein [Ectobacillus polymachus]|uniref:exonuclease domain-containing protein n=1 Tax=Ectobacillus polymachus TaxID=1508806 RepID=UPI003A8710BC
MKNFVAFDFETANQNRHSICSVGMVFVEDGRIVDSVYQLIDPEEDFDGWNIAIHNITPRDVKGAPTFEQFYKAIKDRIDNQLMVAHYLAFDGYALRDNLARYSVQPGLHQLLCTYQLSKRLILGQSSYSLDSLCEYFGIELNNHHHALDDARACADLMIKLVDAYSLNDLEAVYNKTNIKAGEISAERFRSSLVHSKDFSNYKLDLSAIEVALDADREHAFYGKSIVFTGKLNAFSRKEAAELLASKGGTPQNGLNKETNFIVVGDFRDVMIEGNKSTKLLKAEKMINEGKELEIISELDFLKML